MRPGTLRLSNNGLFKAIFPFSQYPFFYPKIHQNNLKNHFEKNQVMKTLSEMNLDPHIRAEDLQIAEFVDLIAKLLEN